MIRWAVAGTGGVSGLFAESMAACDGGEIVAVASRDLERGETFADVWHIPNAGYYDDLVRLPEVDAVYVATPPATHRVYAELALNHGKDVLCEKPLVRWQAEAESLADDAEANGVFLMEAMWPRFLPAYRRLATLLAEGYIGDVLTLDAYFGITQPNRSRPEFSAELGGGALLTGGCYTVAFAHMVLGTPVSVKASGHVGDVDETFSAVLGYESGAVATVRSAITADVGNAARICGTDGTLTLSSLLQPTLVDGDPHWLPRDDSTGPRLLPEIEHVHECITAGLTESPIMGLAESCAIAATIDQIREQL